MENASDAVDAIRLLLPNAGTKFLLTDAATAMEKFYLTDQLETDEDDILVFIAGDTLKENPYFEIGLYRFFGLFNQLEISLRYKRNWRSFFLKPLLNGSKSRNDAIDFFSTCRSSKWFRRYASVPPESCSVTWRAENEMAEIYCEVIPKLKRKLGQSECCIRSD